MKVSVTSLQCQGSNRSVYGLFIRSFLTNNRDPISRWMSRQSKEEIVNIYYNYKKDTDNIHFTNTYS